MRCSSASASVVNGVSACTTSCDSRAARTGATVGASGDVGAGGNCTAQSVAATGALSAGPVPAAQPASQLAPNRRKAQRTALVRNIAATLLQRRCRVVVDVRVRELTKARAPEGVPDPMQVLRTLAVVACGAVACGPRVTEVPERPTSSSSDNPLPEAWPDTAVTDPSGLTFSVEGLEAPSNHAPVLRITLRNVTWDKSLWVKYRASASVNDFFYRDVLLDVIEGPPLRKIACSHCGIGLESLESYVNLGPQSAISVLAGIYCSPLSPGHYRLVAHYHDDSKRPPDFPWRADWFAGALTSEPFEIDVSPLQRP